MGKMINTILGQKQQMSQVFANEERVPVTWVLAGPCVVTQVKTMEKDGYWGLQLGFGTKSTKNITKPVKGHLKGAVKDKTAPRFLREVRLPNEPELKLGDEVKLTDVFVVGDEVAVTGVSKGKGFAGVVKRHDFAGGPATHGQSDRERAPGSIGLGTTPGRIFKGKRMAGRMGNDLIRVEGLAVVAIDADASKLAIRGGVPGAPGTLLEIEKTGKVRQKEVQEQPIVEEEVQEGAESATADAGEKGKEENAQPEADKKEESK